MDTKQFEALLRRAFSKGLSAEEEFELELEAAADDEARSMLEQAEQDDVHVHRLREALTPTPHWYETRLVAMAASALVAVGATLLVTKPPNTPEDGVGLASANVVYLETVRGAGTDELLTVVPGGDEWITFVAYPAYDDFTEFRIRLDRLVADETRIEDTSARWEPVWQRSSDVGTRDSLAVSVKSSVFTAGVYRLRIDGRGVPTGAYAPAADLRFRVAN